MTYYLLTVLLLLFFAAGEARTVKLPLHIPFGRVLLIYPLVTVALVLSQDFLRNTLLVKPSLYDVICAAVLGSVVLLLDYALLLLLKWSASSRSDALVRLEFGTIVKVNPLLSLLICAISATWEEVFYRAVPWLLLDEYGYLIQTLGLSFLSLIFGLQHIRNGAQQVACTTFFGLFFSLCYIITQSIFAVVFAHAVGNIFVIFAAYPQLKRVELEQPARLY